MEPQRTVSDLVRSYFASYESGDRAALEALLSDDFTSHSPHDPQLDKKAYFRKCWPNRRNIQLFQVVQSIDGAKADLIDGETKGPAEDGRRRTSSAVGVAAN